MLRGLFLALIPLLLPTVLFFGYAALMRRRQDRLGPDAPEPWWERPPYLILLGAGVGLMALTLGAWAILDGLSPEQGYQAPRFEDGEIIRPYDNETE